MRNVKEQLVNILNAEVKPALGCTEPVAVALACAKAKELLGEEIVKHSVLVSPNVYKNGMCVGIPGTERLGLKISVALGFIGGHSENGLRVLETLTPEEVKLAEEYMDNTPIDISPADTKEKVYIEVSLQGATRTSKVVIRTKHDNFVYLEANGEVLLDEEQPVEVAITVENEENILDTITIKELVENVEALDFKDIEFLLEGIAMNEEIANYGLNHKVGIGVARMAGIKMPVMSSNGSGNHGITAILPIVAYNKKFPQTDEKLAKALAISHLVTAYVKNYTGRLSAVCGCGVAASTGATAAIAWLMSGDIKKVEGAMEHIVASLSGMICDGAKSGCAVKLASAASAAVQSAIIANQNCFVPSKNGIVGSSVEESIQNLGRVSDKGMTVTDEVIINVMDDMNKVK